MSAFPTIESQELEHRGRVVRMALIYTPVAIVSVLAIIMAIYQVANGQMGFLFTLVFFGIILLLTGFQAVEYLRDLSAAPMEYQGTLMKKWHKGNLLVFFLPSYYLAIDSRPLTARVSRIDEAGAYVTLANGCEGFVPRKELLGEKGQTVGQMVHPGQEIKFKVIGADGEGFYKLSCRKADEAELVTRLFTVTRVEYAMLLEQDLIRVTCYPHSLTVERVERYDDHEKKFVPATSGATV
jgi:hypothetical protein